MSFRTTRSSGPRSALSHSASSPTKKDNAAAMNTGASNTVATGLPKDVEGPYPHFTPVSDDFMPAGNSKFNFMMRNAGIYGHHLARSNKANALTPIALHRLAITDSITTVLKIVLEARIRKMGKTQPSEINTLVNSTANTLTDGCMIMLYMRLRTLHESNPVTLSTFMKRPRVPTDFEIPRPYALAFQYLGIFRVQDLTKELHLVPSLAAADAQNFCLGTRIWSTPAYQAAVDVAKDLGIRFMSVDQTVKLGTAWWLFRSAVDEDDYSLECCLPETNYTDEDATLRALWCHTSAGNLHNDIADLSAYTRDRGSFLRNPPTDIAVTCFLGLMDEPEQVWSIV